MKKILALTAALTLCYSAPVTAGPIINFGLSDDRGSGVIIVPSGQQYWDNVRYQENWGRPYYHPHYRYNRFDNPRYPDNRRYYRYSQFDDLRYQGSRPRHWHGRYYHPRLTLHPIRDWLLIGSHCCCVAAITYNLN